MHSNACGNILQTTHNTTFFFFFFFLDMTVNIEQIFYMHKTPMCHYSVEKLWMCNVKQQPELLSACVAILYHPLLIAHCAENGSLMQLFVYAFHSLCKPGR